jgi:hypothetical protein
MESIWVGVPEAIKISGIKRTCLYHLINDGQLESKKIGKRRFILRKSLMDLRGDSAPASPTASSRPSGGTDWEKPLDNPSGDECGSPFLRKERIKRMLDRCVGTAAAVRRRAAGGCQKRCARGSWTCYATGRNTGTTRIGARQKRAFGRTCRGIERPRGHPEFLQVYPNKKIYCPSHKPPISVKTPILPWSCLIADEHQHQVIDILRFLGPVSLMALNSASATFSLISSVFETSGRHLCCLVLFAWAREPEHRCSSLSMTRNLGGAKRHGGRGSARGSAEGRIN